MKIKRSEYEVLVKRSDAYGDAVVALAEKTRGAPLSTTIGSLIRGGYLVLHPDKGGMTEPMVTYKPGWTFTWGDGYEGGSRWLHIHVEGPDSKGWDRDTMEPRSVTFDFIAPTPLDPDWLRRRLVEIEAHEICEWLRIDGRLEYEPHELEREIDRLAALHADKEGEG